MKRLGLLDDAFLRLESRRQPLHIGVLMLLEPPANAGKETAAIERTPPMMDAPVINARMMQVTIGAQPISDSTTTAIELLWMVVVASMVLAQTLLAEKN